VQTWTRGEAEKAYGAARTEVAERGHVRLGYKPVLDTLLRDALRVTGQQNLPAQFHVGYGDPDVDLRLANPLHLRGLIADPEFAGVSFVLLHACWPFFREGAFLAAVYPNVFLDLSYAIPFFGFREYVAATRAALAVAPWTKIVFSTDATSVPELHWIGALDGRRAVAETLDQLIADRDLTFEEAMQAAQCILHDNARNLYGCK
jgi:predicted TIM-barrel fold metal-dependent hydrolase